MSIFNPPTGLLGLLCRDLRGDMMTTCAKYHRVSIYGRNELCIGIASGTYSDFKLNSVLFMNV